MATWAIARSPGAFPTLMRSPPWWWNTPPSPMAMQIPAYKRDPETMGRAWAIPGTPGVGHRMGGAWEKFGPKLTGNVSLRWAQLFHFGIGFPGSARKGSGPPGLRFSRKRCFGPRKKREFGGTTGGGGPFGVCHTPGGGKALNPGGEPGGQNIFPLLKPFPPVWGIF